MADWAAASGFSALEVCAWPAQESASRRYSGVCHIDVDTLTPDSAQQLVGQLAERGIVISALGYYPNPLDEDPATRQQVAEHQRKVIEPRRGWGWAWSTPSSAPTSPAPRPRT